MTSQRTSYSYYSKRPISYRPPFLCKQKSLIIIEVRQVNTQYSKMSRREEIVQHEMSSIVTRKIFELDPY